MNRCAVPEMEIGTEGAVRPQIVVASPDRERQVGEPHWLNVALWRIGISHHRLRSRTDLWRGAGTEIAAAKNNGMARVTKVGYHFSCRSAMVLRLGDVVTWQSWF